MLYEYALSARRDGFYDITQQVRESIAKSCIADGYIIVFCPHTTAGITITENADPDVARDMLLGLRKAYPDRPQFQAAYRTVSCRVLLQVLRTFSYHHLFNSANRYT